MKIFAMEPYTALQQAAEAPQNQGNLGLNFEQDPSCAKKHKRKHSFDSFGNPKHFKQPLSEKTPLQVLNEKIGRVEFEIDKNEDDPNGFSVSFVYNNDIFSGSGTSKKKAKVEAAKQCLIKYNLEFKQEETDIEIQNNFGPFQFDASSRGSNLDFSSDDVSFDDTNFHFEQNMKPRFLPAEGMFRPPSAGHSPQSRKVKLNLQTAAEFPSMVLHELFPDINKQLTWIHTGSTVTYSCQVEINGNLYSGTGAGKRHAKYELAKSVLSAVYGIKVFRDFKSNIRKENVALTKKHPFTQVKQLDPNAVYEFNEVKTAGNDNSVWEVTLKLHGKEYKALDEEKDKAKCQVSKQACKDYRKMHPDEVMVEDKQIDTGKHPVQMLHEYYQNIEYIEENVSDEHGQMFVINVEVNGKSYTATASSKRKAKLTLAVNIFQDIHQIDPAKWKLALEGTSCENEEDPRKMEIDVKEEKESPKLNMQKNSISLLNELHPGLEYSISEQLEGNRSTFTVYVEFGKSIFEGVGPTKKSAKIVAASKVLDAFYNIKDSVNIEDSMPSIDHTTDIDTSYSAKIYEAVMKKFSQVFHSDTPHKVSAAIVMAKSINETLTDCFEVISIGTGTKCIGGSSINNAGHVINDCHAEIIACRGLRQFLFDQLCLAIDNKDTCLEKDEESGCFQLKSNMHLFLFINTAPCGDGRVYNTTSISSKNKTVGVLRTKIENGQGTVPVPSNKVQTTDGILEGERLLTMSCSDKILRWNILGLQGSLLSLFLEPIYLKGIIIGDCYNYNHLTRSLFSRIQGLTGNALPFKCVKPSFGHCPSTDGRDTSKAPNNSYNWYYGQNTVEIINAITGKTLVSTPSRLSKASFFKKFRDVEKALGLDMKVNTYHEAKHAAKYYQSTKSSFFQHLEEQGYGKWVGKPIEQDTFS